MLFRNNPVKSRAGLLDPNDGREIDSMIFLRVVSEN
jgi:hypothetical protein